MAKYCESMERLCGEGCQESCSVDDRQLAYFKADLSKTLEPLKEMAKRLEGFSEAKSDGK